MILHRSPKGVLSTTDGGLFVVLRTLPKMHVSQRVSVEAFRAGTLDAAILNAFDLIALVEARAREIVAWRGLTIRRSSAFSADEEHACDCHTDVKDIHKHSSMETLVSKTDPRAPIDVGAAVGRCTVCERGWTFDSIGDSHYSYSYSSREFTTQVGFREEEVDRIVLGIRGGGGIEVVIGGSRCHTTYRAREGGEGELIAEDFDEGMTVERSCAEETLRALIADDPESFLNVLRAPLRTRLRDALLTDEPAAAAATSQDAHRVALGELLAFGECLNDVQLLEAVLGEDTPTPDALAHLFDGKSGNDVYHAIMSAVGYATTSAAVGRFGVRVFHTLVELLSNREDGMRQLRRYRASFRAMAGDLALALEDLAWERAHQSKDDPDAPYLEREIEKITHSLGAS